MCLGRAPEADDSQEGSSSDAFAAGLLTGLLLCLYAPPCPARAGYVYCTCPITAGTLRGASRTQIRRGAVLALALSAAWLLLPGRGPNTEPETRLLTAWHNATPQTYAQAAQGCMARRSRLINGSSAGEIELVAGVLQARRLEFSASWVNVELDWGRDGWLSANRRRPNWREGHPEVDFNKRCVLIQADRRFANVNCEDVQAASVCVHI